MRERNSSSAGQSLKERMIQLLREDGLTIAIVLALVVGYAVLSTPGDSFGSTEALQAELASGQPTVVQMYANNCSICLVSKPRVDRLERDLGASAAVVRLNVRQDPGKSLAWEWGVTGVPTFFVFDGEGQLIYRRGGAPDVEAIAQAVARLVAVAD